MQLNRIHHDTADNSAGVSEIIGAVLLIALVVAAVAVIGVFLFSQQTPEKIPNINFMTGTDNSGNLYLYHNGGDSLKKGEFTVRVDGTIKPYILSDDTWSLGKTLTIQGISSGDHSVAIVYNTSGSESVVLRSGSASSSLFTGTINPGDLPGSVGGGTPSEQLANCAAIQFADPLCYHYIAPQAVLDMFMENVSHNSINYYRAGKCDLSQDQIFTIKVMDATSKSSITINKVHPNVIQLSKNDIISIKLNSNTANFRTFGLAPQIWELTGNKVDLSITFANGSKYFSGTGYSTEDIAHTWISDYSNLNSDLAIICNVPGGQGENTALTVNSTQYINGQNNQKIEFKKIRPLTVGLFLIQADQNSAPIYFVGNADGGIWFDNVQQQLGIV